MARELFSFLSSTDYHDITNNAHTPFQKTWRTEIHPFQWFAQNTERFRHFHEGLASMASPAWIDAVAVFRDEAKKISNPPKPRDIPFFVDVGGGFGQQSVLLGQRYPNLLGHIVMQDMPQTISLLPALEGINTQPHDFFQRQPIKGTSTISLILNLVRPSNLSKQELIVQINRCPILLSPTSSSYLA